jgi:tripartite-type tricarboxylate transporter receptor subunit TctC
LFGEKGTAIKRSSLVQPIIIENVTGADGSISTGGAVRARPDGCTSDILRWSTSTLALAKLDAERMYSELVEIGVA